MKLNPETINKIEILEHGDDFLFAWDALDDLFDIKTLTQDVINNNFPLFLSIEELWDQVKLDNSNIADVIEQSDYNKIVSIYNIQK